MNNKEYNANFEYNVVFKNWLVDTILENQTATNYTRPELMGKLVVELEDIVCDNNLIDL